VDRPGLGKIDRPTTLPADRPSIGKPGVGGVDRPGLGKIDRPTTLPADRPSVGKPGVGGLDRPGLGKIDRPTTLPADRPSLGKPGIVDRPGMGKDLPGLGNRPGIGDRPIIGDRPGIGDRPIIGGGNNIGNKIGIGNNIGSGNVGNWIGNDFNFNFNNFNRPGWGYGGNWHNHWGDHWYNHHVNYHHHGWYHGCWSGHWGNNWYVPVAVGATYWGLTALTRTWGYGYYYGYVNPYYVAPTVVATAPAYDYSQPIIINNYIESGDQTVAADGQAAAPAGQAPPPAQTFDQQAGYALLDQGRDAFKRQDYKRALQCAEQAVQKVPNDPVVHEFGALCLFALGDYQRSAGVLNALLAVAPGMDWTTLISLYSSADEYTAQLRALEAHVKSNPNDTAALFVLAYHYLVCGHADSALKSLQRVVEAQPDDQVAKRMYEALKGPEQAPAPPPGESPPAAKPDVEPKPEAVAADEPAPTTDLVGRWQAKRDGNTFDLAIGEQGEFTWKSTPQGQEPTAISGQYAVTGNVLAMESAEQGTMAGRVTSGGPDQFQFVIAGGPPGDPGLTFQRVKKE